MRKLHRPLPRPFVLFVLAAFALVLSACGAELDTGSYAGLSTDGQFVYLAHGEEVVAYDTEAQQPAWRYPTEPDAGVQFYAAPNNVDGQVVFGDYGRAGGFFSPNVTVSIYSLDTRNGGQPSTQWTNSTAAGDKIVAPALQVDDKVFVGTADNHIMALDRANGSPIWDYGLDHAVWGQPTYRDGIVYVAGMDWNMYALNGDTGELVWQTPLNGALASRPVLNGDLLYVSSFDGSVHALDIETGEEVWSAAANQSIWGAPALSDDNRLFFGDIIGDLHAVDALTGDAIWSQDNPGVIQATPLFANDTLYVASQTTSDSTTGSLTAYAAEDGRQLWQVTTPVPLWTTPVIVGDSVVVALENSDALLIGYDLASGAELWRYVPVAPES